MPEPAPVSWWKSILSNESGTGSTHRVLLFLCVVAILVFCGWQVGKRGLDQQVKDLLTWLLSILSGLAGYSKREERIQATATPPKPPAAPGASP